MDTEAAREHILNHETGLGYTIHGSGGAINVATPPHREPLHFPGHGGGHGGRHVPRGTFRHGYDRRYAIARGLYPLPGSAAYDAGATAPSGSVSVIPGGGAVPEAGGYPPVYGEGPLGWIEDHPLLSAALGGLGLYLLLKRR